MRTLKKIICSNGTSAPLLLIIEPWAEEYWIAPHSSVDVIAEGDDEAGTLEMEHVEQGIVIYAWQGSIISVIKDGTPLAPEPQIL